MIFNKLITDQIAVMAMKFVYPENQFKLCRNNKSHKNVHNLKQISVGRQDCHLR